MFARNSTGSGLHREVEALAKTYEQEGQKAKVPSPEQSKEVLLATLRALPTARPNSTAGANSKPSSSSATPSPEPRSPEPARAASPSPSPIPEKSPPSASSKPASP